MAAPDLSITGPDDGVLILRLSGSWRLADDIPPTAQVRQQVESGATSRLRFDTSGLEAWDTGLLTWLRGVLQDCAARQVAAERDGLPDGVKRLIALSEAVPEKKDTGRGGARAPFLVRLGKATESALAAANEFVRFLGEASIAFARLLRGRATFPRTQFWTIVQEVGAEALPIVSLVSLLVGLILAFMGAIQLREFGAEIYVANLVGIGMAREMGPAVLVPARQVRAFPWRDSVQGSYRVAIETDRFEGSRDGSVTLTTRWELLRRGESTPIAVRNASFVEESAGPDFADSVDAMSRAAGRLSREIAAAIQADAGLAAAE